MTNRTFMSAMRASETVTDGLLATNALDQVICTCIYKGVKITLSSRQKRLQATSPYGHNDSLYIHGLKSVVKELLHAFVVCKMENWVVMLSRFILVLHRFRCGA